MLGPEEDDPAGEIGSMLACLRRCCSGFVNLGLQRGETGLLWSLSVDFADIQGGREGGRENGESVNSVVFGHPCQ